jgi:DNA-binding NarL/FixJ family response regulator
VVAEAADGRQAVELACRHRPDVVVMDVRMPVLDGVAAIHALREAGLDVPVLTLTTYDDEQVLAAALRAGAAGFLTKAAPAEDLLRAVKEVAAGAAWLEPSSPHGSWRSTAAVSSLLRRGRWSAWSTRSPTGSGRCSC